MELFSHPFFLKLLFVSCIAASIRETVNAENYYGLPLGIIHDDIFGISADVYIADPHTIVLANYEQDKHIDEFSDVSLMLWKGEPDENTQGRDQGVLLLQTDWDVPERIRKIKRSVPSASLEKVNSTQLNNEPAREKNQNKKIVLNQGNSKSQEKKIQIKRKIIYIKKQRAFLNKTSTEIKQLNRKKNHNVHMPDERAPALTTLRREGNLSPIFITPLEKKTIVLLVPTENKIEDYNWLGIWEDNSQKFYPHINVTGIETPNEEEIGQLQSKADITGTVRILNCNTILVQNFYFNPKFNEKMRFYVGVGEEPTISANLRCHILGITNSQYIEQANGTDLLILLPDTLRTFDIDFMYLVDELTRRIQAFIQIPNVLVPPCD